MDKAKDFERFGILMGVLGENWDKEISPMKVELYFEGLKDFDIEEVDSAVKIALKTLDQSYFPRIAQLRQLIEGDPESRSLFSWRIAVDTRDYYHGADFSEDPIIAYCIQELCGSYMDFCERTMDELKWMEKRFCNLYRLALRRPDVVANVNPVMEGHFQIDNTEKGLLDHVPPIPKISIKPKQVPQIEGQKVKALSK
jgi:hypothetical protein